MSPTSDIKQMVVLRSNGNKIFWVTYGEIIGLRKDEFVNLLSMRIRIKYWSVLFVLIYTNTILIYFPHDPTDGQF
jgi:hypothetical protein